MTTIVLGRSTNRTLDLAITDKNNAPVNLAGAYLWFTAKKDLKDIDSAAVIRKTLGAGITVINEVGGLATVTLVPADTANLDCQYGCMFFWDLQGRDAAGRILTLDHGILVVEADVTRAV